MAAILNFLPPRGPRLKGKASIGSTFVMLRPLYGWTNAGLMLGQHFRWCAIIRLALCQFLVFAVELLHTKLKGKPASLSRGRDNCPLSPTPDIYTAALYSVMQYTTWLRHLSLKI